MKGGLEQNIDIGLSLVREEIPMTMQVGMVGTDGVLLASDTRWVEETRPTRTPWNDTKFKINHRCGVAVARARSMETASRLADEIISLSLENESWRASSDYTSIQRIVAKVFPTAEGRERAQCLVAFTRPTVELCLFQTAKVNGDWSVVPHSITGGSAYAGDEGNQAIFWGERYYRNLKLPIERLIPLAAHLVFAAGVLNSAMIEGLDIVLCNASGIRRLSDESIDTLKLQVAQRDESIRASLFDSAQQFTYAPHVIS
jgi:hypothetical protein